MLTFSVRDWAAWAAGVERRQDWERWCRAPSPLPANGSPALEFVPPLLRRRCSALSRLMIHVAYAACGHHAVGAIPMVFASRYGELALTMSLLESLARAEPLSAAAFTHSIHNTQVALFSIAAKNRHMATALSAGADTFVASMLEALAIVERAGTGPVLLVIADEPVPPALEKFEEQPSAAYALALIIERGGGQSIGLAPGETGTPPARLAWPQPIEFLRWLLSNEPTLTLRGRSAWTAVRE